MSGRLTTSSLLTAALAAALAVACDDEPASAGAGSGAPAAAPTEPGDPPPGEETSMNDRPAEHAGDDEESSGWSNDAGWPAGCLIENVTRHPTRPWLTAACTNAEEERSAVLIFDWDLGRLVYAHHHQGYAGWEGNLDVLRWHPDGDRLGTNVDTNGILVLRDGAVYGSALPDDTRDSGVGYVWVGDSIYTDTDDLIRPDRDYPRYEYPSLGGPEWNGVLVWNAQQSAVVATTLDGGVAAFSPDGARLRWRIAPPPERAHTYVSPDGQHVVRVAWQPGETSEVTWFDGDTGREVATHRSGLGVPRPAWGPDGRLALFSHGLRGPWTVELHRASGPGPTWTSDERIQPGEISELPGVSWSPDGARLAVTLADEVVLLDAGTARPIRRLPARVPAPPPGLPDYYSSRGGSVWWVDDDTLLRIARQAVTIWSTNGRRRATLTVPVGD